MTLILGIIYVIIFLFLVIIDIISFNKYIEDSDDTACTIWLLCGAFLPIMMGIGITIFLHYSCGTNW